MENEPKLVTGAMVTFSIAVVALVLIPYFQIRDVPAPEGLKPYTSAELRGREVYIANGCVYCHSQQPRDPSFGPEPKSDIDKRDQFLVRYSKITNKNLAPFFEAWGIPTSSAATGVLRVAENLIALGR